MNYSIIAFFLLALTLGGQFIVDSEMRVVQENTEIQIKSGQFMNYVYAFDSYYQDNISANGDVTSDVSLPAWLPTNPNIKMYISNKVGYIYMPVSHGVFNEVLKISDSSSAVGVSDANGINTVSGQLSKPAFIGKDNLVYVR